MAAYLRLPAFIRRWLQRMKRRVQEYKYIMVLTFKSLFCNAFLSSWVVWDTLMEPLLWFVEKVVKAFGPVFVFVVVSLVLSVIGVAWLVFFPIMRDRSYLTLTYHLIFGNWLAVNVLFHYFKALLTSPGKPPSGDRLNTEVTTVCKKCITPKPPRTHHCSVCKCCVLKMDHHCPWLNNCVGHYNHRYFFLFCVYIFVGCCYVCYSTYDVFLDHFHNSEKYLFSGKFSLLSPIDTIQAAALQLRQPQGQDTAAPEFAYPANQTLVQEPVTMWEKAQHNLIIYLFFLCSGAGAAVGGLSVWHARLITHGQTSIEVHINKKESKRAQKKGQVYRNPYDYGPRKNWKMFLGLTNGRSWRHILFPSSHPPMGDGLTWHNPQDYGRRVLPI
ncbi:palmitoyltransferase ZDHHC16-like [Branchiostoma lanceolatum]|uniref:palmitoyltransferase ZDHHC16-like n=1 Tax=Branchiostoma lanceolatum TaxID=7740 RepID=UPI0034560302